MGDYVLYSQNYFGTEFTEKLPIFYIFFLIISLRFKVSEASAKGCSLSFKFPSSTNDSRCEGGDWGGFLSRNCCDTVFQNYLHALGIRANQTGLVYLNSSEQMSCLASMKTFKEDVFSCGIEKLTKGGGECSGYSVSDVKNKMGDDLRNLRENCELLNSGREWDPSCVSCVRSWEDIDRKQSVSVDSESLNVESYICKFAVLVSLTSGRIADQSSAKQVYKCLSHEKKYTKNQEPEDKRKKKISTSLWIIVGCIIGAASLVLIAICILSKRFVRFNSPPEETSRNLLPNKIGCRKFSMKEVFAATNSLNELNFIGEGTAGKVYKGMLQNQQHVAVKHIINDGNIETFVREVTSLAHIRHPNLVALLGYCLSQEDCFLIYELCPNGNLSRWLFGRDKFLSWVQRLQIAVGSSRGLLFLHTYSQGCIVHRDIKPTNILLGPNFEAKLSDFGLSKVIDLGKTYVSSEVRGTFGYVDPEYQNNRQVNSSGDVYSFGIVLLQILSGKKVINLDASQPMPLSKMARVLTRGGSIAEFADPKLAGEYPPEAFDLALQLALSCTATQQQRPSMEEVVIRLEKVLYISTKASASTPDSTPDHSSTL